MLEEMQTSIDSVRKLSLLLLACGSVLYWLVQGAVALQFTFDAYNDTVQTYLSDGVQLVSRLQISAILILALVALALTLPWIQTTKSTKKLPIAIGSLIFIAFCVGSALAAEHLLALYASTI